MKDYGKDFGFEIGYAYGLIGYTQYPFLPLISISSITGVWGVVLIVVFPSALLAALLRDGLKNAISYFKIYRIFIIAYSSVFILIIISGLLFSLDTEKSVVFRNCLLLEAIVIVVFLFHVELVINAPYKRVIQRYHLERLH